MDEETQKLIIEQIKQLPANIREAILSVDYKVKLQEITNRQRLLIDQAGKLETETTLVMLGLEPLSNYVDNIKEELQINETRAKEIALDISDNIFKPIRESLQQMYDDVEREEIIQTGKIENPKKEITDELDIDRSQILKEIEDPSIIDNGNRTIEIRPAQGLNTVPGQVLKDIGLKNMPDETSLLEKKMTQSVITSQKVVENEKGNKLPEINKNKPSSITDPYREPII